MEDVVASADLIIPVVAEVHDKEHQFDEIDEEHARVVELVDEGDNDEQYGDVEFIELDLADDTHVEQEIGTIHQ